MKDLKKITDSCRVWLDSYYGMYYIVRFAKRMEIFSMENLSIFASLAFPNRTNCHAFVCLLHSCNEFRKIRPDLSFVSATVLFSIQWRKLQILHFGFYPRTFAFLLTKILRNTNGKNSTVVYKAFELYWNFGRHNFNNIWRTKLVRWK